jgi:hypothetical protein
MDTLETIWTDEVRKIVRNKNKTIYRFELVGTGQVISEFRMGNGFTPKHFKIIANDFLGTNPKETQAQTQNQGQQGQSPQAQTQNQNQNQKQNQNKK